jgi:hypothetical protein
MAVKKPAKKTPVKPVGKGGAKKEEKKGVTYVRGGAICDPKAKGAKLIRGSGAPAVCRTTPGKDPRPRYRAAGH